MAFSQNLAVTPVGIACISKNLFRVKNGMAKLSTFLFQISFKENSLLDFVAVCLFLLVNEFLCLMDCCVFVNSYLK